MITFFVTLIVHCFGRRPIEEDHIWLIALLIGLFEMGFWMSAFL